MENILNMLTHALATHGRQRTTASLGDRSRYIGVSDIAKATNCLRAAVAGKLTSQNFASPSLARELRLQRGHWFEQGVTNAFTASGQPFLHQLEIGVTHKGIPIRAHLDFVFVGQDEEGTVHIQVIECKSCERIPETAHAAYEMQLYGQIGLLRSCWNTPCFTVPENTDGSGKLMSFPALLKKQRGISLSNNLENVVITGSILCLSMNDARVFGPYYPNAVMLNAGLGLAEDIWTAAGAIHSGQMALNDVPTANGHHPLCDYCEVNADCPRFDGIDAPEIEDALCFLNQLREEKNVICQKIQEEEDRLKALCRASLPQGGWLSAETNRIRLVNNDGKRTLDKDLLYSKLIQHLDDDTAAAVIDASHKTGKGYERLVIGSING